jgi:hypothetical protein
MSSGGQPSRYIRGRHKRHRTAALAFERVMYTVRWAQLSPKLIADADGDALVKRPAAGRRSGNSVAVITPAGLCSTCGRCASSTVLRAHCQPATSEPRVCWGHSVTRARLSGGSLLGSACSMLVGVTTPRNFEGHVTGTQQAESCDWR